MTALLFAILISATLYLVFDHKESKLIFVFKPLTTILVIILAFLQPSGISETYKYLILTGLGFSLIGDVFLMLPSDKFVHGLASFLIAHIFFIAAFTLDFGPYFDWMLLIPGLIYSIIFLKVLLPKTGKLKIPVFFYALVLFVFLWQATGRFYYLAETTAFYSLLGAILFIISDSFLAYSRFVKKSEFSSSLIHFSYWGALAFLAFSI
jgi:uncharacterized membrane protein YhhN